MVLTKIDLLPHVPFDMEKARANARAVHPGIEILEVSCSTGAGMNEWLAWLEMRKEAMLARVCAAEA
jgi:hydrogenase nickel incorporation protein HypB